MTELTTDQLRHFTAELQKRDPRFLRIVEADAGTGTYELRSATTGATATGTFTFCEEHNCLHTPRFDQATRDRMAADAAKAPKPYAIAIEARHAAEAAAETSEQKYQKRRLAEFQAEYRRAKEATK